MAFSLAKPWNEGERSMQRLLRVPAMDNPTSTLLTPQASFMLQRGPLLAVGTLDRQWRPWTTLWGGSAGFCTPLGGNLVGIRTVVDGENDPVVQALVGDGKEGEMVQAQGEGVLISALAFDLMTRKRVKLAGSMVAGTVTEVDVEVGEAAAQKQNQIQLVTEINESLGNCPKYLNQYDIRPAVVTSEVKHIGPALSNEGRALISRADMFFLSTSTAEDMDTNHRGGSPGFVRVISTTQIVYPEYSGNRLYQSLGNLKINPRIGITFPDFDTGDVLYITGTAEVMDGSAAASILPGSSLAVRITCTQTRFVASGLALRGTRKTRSPYNPLVRTLATEGNIKANLARGGNSRQHAQLTRKEVLTSSIMRFTFSVAGGIQYAPGQWIAMDFKEELDTGYEHMRDDEPSSINDDFIRTFTISSAPQARGGLDDDFQITIRAVGPATRLLFGQNDRAGFEVPILGVGGDFKIAQKEKGVTPFIAGGVGITPLLGQLETLVISRERLKLIWSIRMAEASFVLDVLHHRPELARCTDVYLTGAEPWAEESSYVTDLEGLGVGIAKRRLAKSDVDAVEAETWYLCVGKLVRSHLLSCLEGKTVHFESFDY